MCKFCYVGLPAIDSSCVRTSLILLLSGCFGLQFSPFSTRTNFAALIFFGCLNGCCCNLRKKKKITDRHTWIAFRGPDDVTLTVIKWSFLSTQLNQTMSKVTRLLTTFAISIEFFFVALHCLLSSFCFFCVCVCGIVFALIPQISLLNRIHSTFVSIG